MITGILVAVSLTLLAFALSGARSMAYLLYFLAYLPFLSPDPSSGGLQDVEGLVSPNVLFKMTVRLVTSVGCVLLLVRHREALRHVLRPVCLPILFFFLWALAGLHRAQSPWIAFFRLGELLAFFLTGVCLFLEAGRFHSPRQVARWHGLALLPLCLVTLYYARTRPDLASHVEPGGLRLGHEFLEPNVLGFAAVAVMLWATHELREVRERQRHWVLERLLPLLSVGLALLVLFYSRSRTAMITGLVGQFVLWFPFYKGGGRRRALFTVFVVVAVGASLVSAESILAWFLRGEALGNLATATGRTGLWQALLTEQVPRAPMLGAGYMMLGERGFFDHAGTYWNNAHNTYLFALVSTGIPGLLAVGVISVTPAVMLFKRIFTADRADRPSWVLLLAMQTVIVITNLTGFGICGYPNAAMFYSYAVFAYCVTAPRRPSAARARGPRPLASSLPPGPLSGSLSGPRGVL